MRNEPAELATPCGAKFYMKQLLWITNHPKSIKGLWPRRGGVEYIQGEPKATAAYSVDELKSLGLVGAYVDMDAEEYRKLPIIKSAKE